MTTKTIEKPMEPNTPLKTNAEILDLVIKLIKSPGNIRILQDEKAAEIMANSVRRHGVLQPILVRVAAGNGGFELIAGHRRLAAAVAAGLARIPARVLQVSDQEAAELMILENLDRKDLHPLEEAEGFRRLVAFKYDAARIAERVGRSVPFVYDRLKLLNLIEPLRKDFLAGKFEAAHAIILSRLPAVNQKRVISEDALYEDDSASLFDDSKTESKYDDGEKAVSAKRLQSWVDDHVKFDQASADAFLFPEATMAFKKLEEKVDKVVSITLSHYTRPEIREDGERVIGPQSWERADKQICDKSVIGVIVAGTGRGRSFRVCINKEKCKTHWGDWQKARAKAKTQERTTGGHSPSQLRQTKPESQASIDKRERAEFIERAEEKALERAVLGTAKTGLKRAHLVYIAQLAVNNWYGQEHLKDVVGFEVTKSGVEKLTDGQLATLVFADRVTNGGDDIPADSEAKKFGVDAAAVKKQAATAAANEWDKKKIQEKEKSKKAAKGGTDNTDPDYNPFKNEEDAA